GVQAVTVTTAAGAGRYHFVPDTIDVRVGRVRLTFRNTGNTPHNLTFDNLVDAGRRVAVGTLRGGAEETVDFTPGTPGGSRFVCTIPQALAQPGVLNWERSRVQRDRRAAPAAGAAVRDQRLPAGLRGLGAVVRRVPRRRRGGPAACLADRHPAGARHRAGDRRAGRGGGVRDAGPGRRGLGGEPGAAAGCLAGGPG